MKVEVEWLKGGMRSWGRDRSVLSPLGWNSSDFQKNISVEMSKCFYESFNNNQ